MKFLHWINKFKPVSKSPWEFQSDKKMIALLVGEYFGPEREERIDQIRRFKADNATLILDETRVPENGIALEIGSGCGYVSRCIAPKVKRLYCCDVSQSFLNFAGKECRGIGNIEFHKIVSRTYNFEFLEPGSLDLVYSVSVFIHLNLYEIYFYFQEIARVLKPNGRLWIDIVDEEKLDLQHNDLFHECARCYKTSELKDTLLFMKWNSSTAIKSIAKYFGLSCEFVRPYSDFPLFKKWENLTTGPQNYNLLFIKK